MNRATQVLVGTLAFSAGMLGAFPREAGAQTPDPNSPGIFCLGKTVGISGRPLARVHVTAYEMQSDGVAGNIELRVIGLAVTDDDGDFRFETQARPGRSMGGYIVATRPGWALGWAEWNLQEDTQLRLELGTPRAIAGVIVDEAGKPVEGASVRANLTRARTTADGVERREWLPGIAPLDDLGTRTSSQGWFRFDNIPAGSGVDLLVTAPGKAVTYTFSFDGQSRPRFRAGQTDIKVVLPAEGRIEGKIVDVTTGKGVPRVQLGIGAAFSPAFYYRFVCTSAPDGSFSVRGLRAGDYSIHGSEVPARRVTVQAGRTVDATIYWGTKALYGRVLFQDGCPAVIDPPAWSDAGICITLQRGDEPLGLRLSKIDEEGFFEVRLSHDLLLGLQAGQAWLSVDVPRSEPGRADHVAAFPLDSLSADRPTAGVVRIPRPVGEPASLIGKPLPALDGFESIDVNLPATQERVVLVCFFDMRQRPSRHCLSELAKQSELLTAKGVAVVGVQAGRGGFETGPYTALAEWVEQNHILFPIGRIHDNIEQVKAAWGIRSLPWLILTDNRPVVTAEGFPLADLDGILQGLAKQK